MVRFRVPSVTSAGNAHLAPFEVAGPRFRSKMPIFGIFGKSVVKIGTYTACSDQKVVTYDFWSHPLAVGPDFVSKCGKFTDFMPFSDPFWPESA